jgi:hypothetical protein
MFTNVLNAFAAPAGLKGLLAAAVLGVAPTAALARHPDFHVDFDFRQGRPHVEIVAVRPPPPVYEDRQVRAWVEPVYRTVTERQWIAPEYRTVSDRVWCPAQFEVRDVERWVHARPRIERARVLVQPGHFEDVTRQEVVCEGHWQDVTRQELVVPGHYETRIERVAVGPRQW